MDQIFQFLTDNIVGIIGILVAVIGIPLTIIFANLSKRKKIFYMVETDTLISDFGSTIKGINITHNNNEMESLCVSKLYIWNEGKSVLDKADLHMGKPITIVIDPWCNALDVSLVAETDETCGFELIPDDKYNRIVIAFECLESGYGGVFQILHTGVRGHGIDLDGKIKNNGLIHKTTKRNADREETGLIIFGCSSVALITALLFLSLQLTFEFIPKETILFTCFIFFLGVLSGGITLITAGKNKKAYRNLLKCEKTKT
ncbi:MAG: hypothetical protein FWD03_05975 [Defluviitaleaceae bacterium]|nr:hypothetical protein [Defluviitaleaceae bacterium]